MASRRSVRGLGAEMLLVLGLRKYIELRKEYGLLIPLGVGAFLGTLESRLRSAEGLEKKVPKAV